MFKNKILEAVNNAVYNVLSADIQDQDIDFDTDDIDTAFNLINEKVKTFMEHPSYENYTDMRKYSLKTKCRYTVMTLDELQRIFDKINGISHGKMDWVDFNGVLCFLTSDGQTVYFDEFNRKKTNVDFIKIYGASIRNGAPDIIIHKNLMIRQMIRWYHGLTQEEMQRFDKSQCVIIHDKNECLKCMDGFENTYHNVNMHDGMHGHNKFNLPDIFMHVKNMDVPGFTAYIPAIGQLMTLYDHIEMMNYFLKAINGNQLDKLVHTNLWSSTEHDGISAYYLERGTRYIGKYVKNKTGYIFEYTYNWSGSKQDQRSYDYKKNMAVMPFFIKK